MNHPLTDLPDPILEMEAQVKTFIFISLNKNVSTPTEGFNSSHRGVNQEFGYCFLSLSVYFERFRLKLEEVEKAFWVILGRFSKAGKWTFMCPSGEGKCHF